MSTATNFALRVRASRFILTLGLLVIAASLSAAQQTGAVRKNEFKLIITSVDADTALRILGLERQQADTEIVYYFDTGDRTLQAHHVTLRARQSAGRSGDSTVKLRARAGTLDLNDEERALSPDQDWTSEHEPGEARSVSRQHLEKGLVAKAGMGSIPVAELFNETQRHLVEALAPRVSWETLVPFGPVEAEVWKRQTKLVGFAEPVTVELWHLQQDGRKFDILEISAKARSETNAEAQSLASQFFAAARAAGLGEPDGQTKTELVMDFFLAGR